MVINDVPECCIPGWPLRQSEVTYHKNFQTKIFLSDGRLYMGMDDQAAMRVNLARTTNSEVAPGERKLLSGGAKEEHFRAALEG